MENLPYEIAETAQGLRRAFDQRAAILGVTRAQWRVLFSLERRPGLKQVDLADRLDIEPITLCRHVDRLEEAELVERRRDPADRRAWRLFITDKAAPLVEQLHTLGSDLLDQAFSGIDAQELETLRRLLGVMRGNLAAIEAKPKAANA